MPKTTLFGIPQGSFIIVEGATGSTLIGHDPLDEIPEDEDLTHEYEAIFNAS
jgi:hypothetical protein